MSHVAPPPLDLLRRIDQASDRFESAWRSGTPLLLEVLLREFVDSEQGVVLRELLPLEIALLREAGRQPDWNDIRRRFKQQRQVVDAVAREMHAEMDAGTRDEKKFISDSAKPVNSESFAEAEPSVAAVSRYQATRLHAQGGLGVVYAAEDLELRRMVALKEIKEKFSAAPVHRQQFLFEAEVTGALEHPGVVPVHGLGTYSDGRPFYAMRFIRGVSLKEAVQQYFLVHTQKLSEKQEREKWEGEAPAEPVVERMHGSAGASPSLNPDSQKASRFLDVVLPSDRGLAFRELLTRFCDVCNTLEYAHSRGVLHRDLKPDNIMLGKYGETFVVDWGLATLVDVPLNQPFEESLLRGRLSGSGQTGSVVGTPGYMSPEQAAGDVRLTSATDVYGLGATLYFLLTGQPPISTSGKLTEVLARIRTGEFPAPNKVRADVPAALNAVCLKALARQPEERYSSALELKRDLQRWLADEPVTAYREPWTTRARRWAKRHKTLVTTSAVSATLLLAVLGTWSVWNAHRVQRLSIAAKSALRDAESALQQQQFEIVREQLATAKARVQSESAFADLLPAVTATEAQYRLIVTTDAEVKLRRADELAQELKFTEAAALFARVRASLEGDDTFAGLRQRAHSGEVQAQTYEQAEVRWQQFRRLAEKARFFGSYIGGGSSTESASRALKAAEEALLLITPATGLAPVVPALLHYEQDAESSVVQKRGNHPGKQGGDFTQRTLTSSATSMNSATSERQNELRSLTFELLLIRAETQVLVNQEESQRTAILESSLELLTQAERLLAPQTSRIVWTQRAAYLRQIGKLSESQAAAKVATETAPQSALEFFLAGESARRVDRDFAQAEANYLEALRRSPRDHWIHFALGACQLERMGNKFDEAGDREDRRREEGFLAAAIHALTSSRALAPDFPWPLVLRGYAYAEMKDFVHAEQDFAEVEAIVNELRDGDFIFDPRLLRSAVQVNRAALRIRQAEHAADEVRRNDFYERAVTELQAALQDNDLYQARFNLGLVLSRLKRYAEAREAWTAVLNHAEAQEPLLRAEILQHRGDGTLEQTPSDSQSLMLARKDFLEALTVLERLSSESANLQASRQRSQLRERLGRTYLQTQEWSLALAQFDAATKESAASPNLQRFRGQCLMKLNRHAEALAAYSDYAKQTLNSTAGLREKPDVAALRTLGMLSLQSGAWRESLSVLSRSMDSELDGKIATKHGWLLTTGLWPIVLEDFDRAIAWHRMRGEEDWEAYAGRAFARAKLGQHKTAIDDIEKAIQLGSQQIDSEPPPINPQQQKGILLFNAACTYAVVVRHLRLNSPAESGQEEQIQELTQRAIELLRLSQERLGAKILVASLADDALDSIRETMEFKSIQRQLTESLEK